MESEPLIDSNVLPVYNMCIKCIIYADTHVIKRAVRIHHSFHRHVERKLVIHCMDALQGNDVPGRLPQCLGSDGVEHVELGPVVRRPPLVGGRDLPLTRLSISQVLRDWRSLHCVHCPAGPSSTSRRHLLFWTGATRTRRRVPPVSAGEPGSVARGGHARLDPSASLGVSPDNICARNLLRHV